MARPSAVEYGYARFCSRACKDASEARPLEVRFWEKVVKDGPVPAHRPDLGPCWTWTGSLDGKGYGQIAVGDRIRKAHQIAHELLVGPRPDGLEPDHLCRNPSCPRPDHLEFVDHAEHVRRHAALTTHCPAGHPYDDTNTRWNKRGGRACRACDRIKHRATTRHEAAAT